MKKTRYNVKGPKLKTAQVGDFRGKPNWDLYTKLKEEKDTFQPFVTTRV